MATDENSTHQNDSNETPVDGDDALDEILAEYLERLEDGQAPDP